MTMSVARLTCRRPRSCVGPTGTPLPSLRTTLADDDELDPSATFIGEELERRVLAIKGNAVCADCATSDARKYAALPSCSTNLGSLRHRGKRRVRCAMSTTPGP
jgi:hypothetical protein